MMRTPWGGGVFISLIRHNGPQSGSDTFLLIDPVYDPDSLEVQIMLAPWKQGRQLRTKPAVSGDGWLRLQLSLSPPSMEFT